MDTYDLLHFEHKNDIQIIIKLPRATCLRLMVLYKSLTVIVTSFLCSKCNWTYIFMELVFNKYLSQSKLNVPEWPPYKFITGESK